MIKKLIILNYAENSKIINKFKDFFGIEFSIPKKAYALFLWGKLIQLIVFFLIGSIVSHWLPHNLLYTASTIVVFLINDIYEVAGDMMLSDNIILYQNSRVPFKIYFLYKYLKKYAISIFLLGILSYLPYWFLGLLCLIGIALTYCGIKVIILRKFCIKQNVLLISVMVLVQVAYLLNNLGYLFSHNKFFINNLWLVTLLIGSLVVIYLLTYYLRHDKNISFATLYDAKNVDIMNIILNNIHVDNNEKSLYQKELKNMIANKSQVLIEICLPYFVQLSIQFFILSTLTQKIPKYMITNFYTWGYGLLLLSSTSIILLGISNVYGPKVDNNNILLFNKNGIKKLLLKKTLVIYIVTTLLSSVFFALYLVFYHKLSFLMFLSLNSMIFIGSLVIVLCQARNLKSDIIYKFLYWCIMLVYICLLISNIIFVPAWIREVNIFIFTFLFYKLALYVRQGLSVRWE